MIIILVDVKFCINVVREASYAKDLKSIKLLENEKQFETIIREWLLQDLFEYEPRKIYIPKSIKQLPRENIIKYEKELAKKILNPYYFTDRALHVGFGINLDSCNINNAKSKLIIKPIFADIAIETSFEKKSQMRWLLFMVY